MEKSSKVSDLIELLSTLDPDKEIRLVGACGYVTIEGEVPDLELYFDESKKRIHVIPVINKKAYLSNKKP